MNRVVFVIRHEMNLQEIIENVKTIVASLNVQYEEEIDLKICQLFEYLLTKKIDNNQNSISI